MARNVKSKSARSRLGRTPSGEWEDRNERILDAAMTVFLERGFAGATMTAIARQAECSLETLYTTYANKAKMFTALTTRRATGLYKAIGPLKPDRDLQEALLRFATEVMALMMRPDVKDLHRLVVAESRDFPELGLNFWKEGTGNGIKMLDEFFQSKEASGAMKVSSTKRAAEVYVSLVLGIVTMKSVVGVRSSAETKKEQLGWAKHSVSLFMTLIKSKTL